MMMMIFPGRGVSQALTTLFACSVPFYEPLSCALAAVAAVEAVAEAAVEADAVAVAESEAAFYAPYFFPALALILVDFAQVSIFCMRLA